MQARDEPVERGLQARCLEQRLLGKLALGNVDDGTQHQRFALDLERSETDLDRHFAAVLAQAIKVSPGAHRSLLRGSHESAAVSGMVLAKALRDQQLDRLSHHFLAGVSEQRLGLSI